MDVRTKISGLILNDQGELLIFKNKGKDVWTCPGGKIEEGEAELECLKRELMEECKIDLEEAEFLVETPVEPAAGNPGQFIIMKFYVVKSYQGEPTVNPDDSVEEMKWISRDEFMNRDFEIGSGLVKFAIPNLIYKDLMK
jgi:8-oxo-dGTP diphosphatase